MADPHVVSQLRAKQAELQAAVGYFEGKLAEARTNLMHVNATLRLFELPEDGVQRYPTHINLARIFPRGELLALSIAALREFGVPMTSRALSKEIVRRKGWDVNDVVLQRGITAKLKHPLLRAARKGRLRECDRESGLRVWGLPC